MILHREELVRLEEFYAKQEQIYPDAADVGIPIHDGQNPHIREECREIVRKMTGICEHYEKHTNCANWRFFIPIEINDYDSTKEDGIAIDFAWNKDPRRKVEFLSIGLFRATRKRQVN